MKRFTFTIIPTMLLLCSILIGCTSNVSISIAPQSEATDGKPSKQTDLSNEITAQENEPVTEISDLYELRDYLVSNYHNGNLSPSFRYTGEDKPDGSVLAKMLCCIYLYYRVDGNGVYTCEITPFPGDRIAKAYLDGDVSFLSSDELLALSEAESILNEASSDTSSSLEFEIKLHDLLIERISYYDGSLEIENAERLPRHLTAIGALLDGKANCQGYTDAFNTIATMYGMNVGRMCVETEEGAHMLSTLELDEKWYIVDVTHNDTATTEGCPENFYRVFNVGKDKCALYSWQDMFEYRKISETTDNYFYYALPYSVNVSPFGNRIFRDVRGLCDFVIESNISQGTDVFNLMLEGTVIPVDEFKAHFDTALNGTGMSYAYTLWCCDNGSDTFIIIKFE